MSAAAEVARAAKAVSAGVGALATAMATAAADGHVTQTEVWIAVGLAVPAAAAVYAIPNATRRPRPPRRGAHSID